MLTPREVYTVAGANTYFFIKPIDDKKNLLSANTYWSFGDGSEGYGATTTHRYYSAGEYIAYVESEISNAYGVERIRVIVSNPDITISEVGDNFIKIKNNSNQELNIGGFIISSDQGFYKLSRQLILKEGSELKIDGRLFGFSKLTNAKILAPDMSPISAYKNNIKIENPSTSTSLATTSSIAVNQETKATLTENNSANASTSQAKPVSNINNKNIKYIYKNGVKTKQVWSQDSTVSSDIKKLEKKENTKKEIKENSKNVTKDTKESKEKSAKEEVGTNTKTVDIPSIKKDKNWLYWLYE